MKVISTPQGRATGTADSLESECPCSYGVPLQERTRYRKSAIGQNWQQNEGVLAPLHEGSWYFYTGNNALRLLELSFAKKTGALA